MPAISAWRSASSSVTLAARLCASRSIGAHLRPASGRAGRARPGKPAAAKLFGNGKREPAHFAQRPRCRVHSSHRAGAAARSAWRPREMHGSRFPPLLRQAQDTSGTTPIRCRKRCQQQRHSSCVFCYAGVNEMNRRCLFFRATAKRTTTWQRAHRPRRIRPAQAHDCPLGALGSMEARHFNSGRGDIKRFQARPAEYLIAPFGSLLPPMGLLRGGGVILQGGNGCGRSSARSVKPVVCGWHNFCLWRRLPTSQAHPGRGALSRVGLAVGRVPPMKRHQSIQLRHCRPRAGSGLQGVFTQSALQSHLTQSVFWGRHVLCRLS